MIAVPLPTHIKVSMKADSVNLSAISKESGNGQKWTEYFSRRIRKEAHPYDFSL
jgi:hypothetical protein